MVHEQNYVSLNESLEHIKRHFSDGQAIGSKFFPQAQQSVIDLAEETLMKTFYAAHSAGQPAGRVVLQLTFPDPVGTDALVALQEHADKPQIAIVRDAATPGHAVVTAVESASAPATATMTIVAGPYRENNGWGIYTMFPGKSAPAMPNDTQTEQERTISETFWRTHGFLATRAEIACFPRADGKPHYFDGDDRTLPTPPSHQRPAP